MKSLSILKNIFIDLQKKYHVNIIIKDFYCILRTKTNFLDLLNTFYSHNNPYCLYIKNKPEAFRECLMTEHTKMGREMNTKAVLYENGVFHTCPFGVREFYYPIRCSGYTIGALIVGCSSCAPEAFSAVSSVTDSYAFPQNVITEMYDKNIRPCSMPNEDEFWQQIVLCGEVLTMACEKLLSYTNIECIFRYGFILDNADLFDYTENRLNEKRRLILKNASSENRPLTIVINAITYIENNYHKKITIEDIAKYCYCSSSTLSHVFAKNYGMTIGKLIQIVRCDRAKALLKESSMPVSEIAWKCGFSSADYFTSVFKNLTGVTPTEYRANNK